MANLIKKQVSRINNNTPTGLLLDIDDTICATNLYLARLFNEQYGNLEGLSPEEIVLKYRYPSQVPSWQTPEIAKRQNEIFDSGSHIPFSPAVDKSLEYVLMIDAVIPISGYLTGRPDRFQDITLHWLSKHGFPQKQIVMRPQATFLPDSEIANGFEWKARILQSLPNVLGTIDDSFEITSYLPENYNGTIFLYSHGAGTPNFPFTVNCPTWKDVYKEVSKKFGTI